MLLDVGIVFAAYTGIKLFKKYRENNKSKSISVKPDKQLQAAALEEAAVNETKKQQQHYLKMSAVSAGLAAIRNIYTPIAPLSLGVFTYTAIPKVRRFEKSLIKERKIDGYVLYFFADILTLALGYYFTAAVAVGLYHVGETIITNARDNSKKMLLDAFEQQQPSKVWVLKDNAEIEMPLEAIAINDIILVNAGDVVPVDGIIMDGMATIDQHTLTGESQPAEKGRGDKIFAGTGMVTGRIFVKVEKSGADTTLSQISQVLSRSNDFVKTNQQLKGEKWADTAILPMLGIAGLSLPILGPVGTVVILNSHISGLIRVIAPLGTLNYLSVASHQGILIKDGRALEGLNKVDTVLFDKTGTLTDEQPKVGRIILCNKYGEEEILTYAAAAERQLTHPIAKAILKKAEEANLTLPNIEDSNYKIGYGITVKLDNQNIQVGSTRFMTMERIALPSDLEEAIARSHRDGNSWVMVAVNNKISGAIEIQTRVRPEVTHIINGLRQRGIKHIAIVSGDHKQPTQKLAESLSMDSYFYDILPENKAKLVEQLQKEGKTVCFVGDGINDAIAMKKANVSISLRGATSIATDVAQVVLMDGTLSHLCDLFDISKDLDANLQKSLMINTVPGVITFGGAFLLHFGILTAVTISGASLLVGVGNAMLPLRQIVNKKSQSGSPNLSFSEK